MPRRELVASGSVYILAVACAWSVGATFLAATILGFPALVVIGRRYPEMVIAGFMLAGSTQFGGPDYSVSVSLVLGLATLVLLLISFASDGVPPIPVAIWLLCALALVLLAGLAYGDRSTYGIEKALRFSTLGILLALVPACLLRNTATLRRFLVWIVGVSTVLSAAAIGASFVLGTPGRYTALGAGTTTLARINALAFGVIFIAILEQPTRAKWAAPLAGLSLFTLLGTASRGPLVALVVGLTFLYLAYTLSGRIRPATLVTALTAGFVAATLGWLVIPPTALQRISLLFASDPGVSISLRVEGLRVALSSLMKYPMAGLGTGGFAALRPWLKYPHNILAELGVENGLGAVVIMIAVLVMALYSAITVLSRIPDTESAVVLFVLVFGITNALVAGDINTNSIMLVFVGIATARAVAADSLTSLDWPHAQQRARSEQTANPLCRKLGTKVGS